MEWLKFKPRTGDLFILDYHKGRRVGVFIKSNLKSEGREYRDSNLRLKTVWTIMWIPVENEKSPSMYLTESTIFNYLRIGAGRIYRRNDEI